MTSYDSTVSREDYVLGRTTEEYRRLRLQAKMWESVTIRTLQQAGLREGMSCLDLGCGPGEVMRLMGEMVGPGGHVTGLDADGNIGRQALEMLKATTKSRFAFFERELDSTEDIPGQPFDLTYARLLLFHVRDPLAMLKKMSAWTKPGGYVVVQDYDLCAMDIYPRLEYWDEYRKVLFGVFEQSGRDSYLGHKLPAYFAESGIGPPDGTDVTGRLGSLAQYGTLLSSVYQSLLPRAIQLGLTTEAESRLFLEELSRAEKDERYHSVLMPLMISVWKRKPI